jgi:DNA polymerase III delta prime subunit
MNETTHKLLIHQYRPQAFTDVEDRCRTTVNVLKNYIALDKLHLLLIGDEGTGKTVWLDIIVKEYYLGVPQEVYGHNVLRINSLYEQGVNYFRTEVKHFCQTCSTVPTKKKMLVIDDIDLLPEMSQHLICAIIDNYKQKIQLVSACTNIYKLIPNIQTRLMCINMPIVSHSYLRSIVYRIVMDHSIDIEEVAINHIIMVSNNRINRLLNNFEKVVLYKYPITLQIGYSLCSHINICVFDIYMEHIRDNNIQSAVHQLYQLSEKGFSVIDILDTFFSYIKITSMVSEEHKYQLIELICKYINIFYTIHEDQIELALLTNDIIRRIHCKI